jgi:hypothetical protein
MARMMQESSGKPFLTAPAHCPLYPNHGGAFSAPAHALIRPPQKLSVLLAQARISVLYRVVLLDAPLRTRSNRGPPARLSA